MPATALGADIGAPPEPLLSKGRAGGIPPPNPPAMQSQRLAGIWLQLIRSNMRYYGALRLDHVIVSEGGGGVPIWVGSGGCAATMALCALSVARSSDGVVARERVAIVSSWWR